jgi:hypothetical protein
MRSNKRKAGWPQTGDGRRVEISGTITISGLKKSGRRRLSAWTPPSTAITTTAFRSKRSLADQRQEDPLDGTFRREMARVIADRLQELPEMQRKVLALYYFEDMRLRGDRGGVRPHRIAHLPNPRAGNLAIKSFLLKFDPHFAAKTFHSSIWPRPFFGGRSDLTIDGGGRFVRSCALPPAMAIDWRRRKSPALPGNRGAQGGATLCQGPMNAALQQLIDSLSQ